MMVQVRLLIALLRGDWTCYIEEKASAVSG
jgi:hypothetical protein